MTDIRYVSEEDKEFWFHLDLHHSEEEFNDKISRKMGYVLLDNNKPVGILRYNLFWDNIPFCTMLFVDKESRGKGYGKELVKHWEDDMKSKGFGMVMTSTQVDENAQYFFRKLGYLDAGCLLLNIPGYEQSMEIFFTKAI